MNRFLTFIAAALLLAHQNTAAATLSTMAMPDAGYDLVTWNTWKAQSFSLAATTAPGAVLSVSLSLEVVVPNANFVVRVVGSTGTPARPDISDIRAELRPVAMPVGVAVAVVTFASDSGFTSPPLAAEATYWLVAGMTGEDFNQPLPAGLVRWHYAGTYGQDAGAQPGWTVGSTIASSDTAGGDWVPVTGTPYLFDLTAVPVPVPEPSAAALLPVTALCYPRRRTS